MNKGNLFCGSSLASWEISAGVTPALLLTDSVLYQGRSLTVRTYKSTVALSYFREVKRGRWDENATVFIHIQNRQRIETLPRILFWPSYLVLHRGSTWYKGMYVVVEYVCSGSTYERLVFLTFFW